MGDLLTMIGTAIASAASLEDLLIIRIKAIAQSLAYQLFVRNKMGDNAVFPNILFRPFNAVNGKAVVLKSLNQKAVGGTAKRLFFFWRFPVFF